MIVQFEGKCSLQVSSTNSKVELMVQVETALHWNLEIVDEGILLLPFLALSALKLCLVFTKCDKRSPGIYDSYKIH